MSEQNAALAPCVETFEQAVAEKDYEKACTELLAILSKIDQNFGGIDGIEFVMPIQVNALEKDKIVYFCTRMAVAITELFKDPNLELSEPGTQRFLSLQRWLSLIFASSPFVNADHILQSYNINPESKGLDNIHIAPNDNAFMKFCICYLPESNVSINLDSLWDLNPYLCASLAFALQSPRFVGTEQAFSKRNVLLQWFPEKLAQIEELDKLPSGISHDVYMHCSYDVAANKHLVKKSLNQVIRRHILKYGWQDRDVSSIGTINGKPVMVVVLEHFHSSHSIYRTHSTSLVAAREHFYIVAFGSSVVDQAAMDVFDEYHLIEGGNVMERIQYLRKYFEQHKPAILYMPSIGMDLHTIFLSNTRVAPIQVVALGHPATTHSDFIEYVIVEDDYVGSEDCFSETLLRLPKDALPYVPSALAPKTVDYLLRENPEVVNIGIASTTMKLNPYFLGALRSIRDRAKVKVHFHFALGQSTGVTHPYVERFIKSYLGDSATAHPHTPYHQYLEILRNCDMMVNPFPFGNTNGIIDMVTLGLVGICKTGPEVHEHIDEGLFKRLGLPEGLIANTIDEYIERAISLAENHQERLNLRRHIIETNGLNTLFSGDPRPMGRVLLAKVNELSLTRLEDTATKTVAKTKTPATKSKAKPAKKTAAKKSAEKPLKAAVKKSTEKPLKEVVKKLSKTKK